MPIIIKMSILYKLIYKLNSISVEFQQVSLYKLRNSSENSYGKSRDKIAKALLTKNKIGTKNKQKSHSLISKATRKLL